MVWRVQVRGVVCPGSGIKDPEWRGWYVQGWEFG